MNTNRDSGFRRRVIALAIITTIIMGIFILRLAQFQIFPSSNYTSHLSNSSSLSSA